MAEERIDPNSADLEALRQLPGIGAGLAQRIVDRRPYRTAQDLLAVPGVGSATLERIRPRLRFEAPEPPAAAAEPKQPESAAVGEGTVEPKRAAEPGEPESAPEGVGDAESERAEQAEAKRVAELRPGEAETGEGDRSEGMLGGRLESLLGGSPSWWAALGLAAASALCSISLTLLVLLGINGTLDYGRHAAVRRVESRASQLESAVSEANSELSAVRRRLEVIEGLSGRMAGLEGRMDQTQQQLEQMAGALDDMQQQVDSLQQQSDRLDRIEAFFIGLQELLGQWFPAPEG